MWNVAKGTALNRVRWCILVEDLCSTRNEEEYLTNQFSRHSRLVIPVMKGFALRLRFEKEVQENSKMAYCSFHTVT